MGAAVSRYPDYGAQETVNGSTIRMPYLPENLNEDPHPVVTQRSPVRLRRIAEQLARQFQRETHFDFAPYSAHESTDTVILSPAQRRLITHARLVAGGGRGHRI